MPEESILDSIMAMGGSEGAGFLAILKDTSLKGLEITSELPPPAIIPWAVLGMIANRMGSKVLKSFMKSFLKAQVIKDRKRALELVELMQSSRQRAGEED